MSCCTQHAICVVNSRHVDTRYHQKESSKFKYNTITSANEGIVIITVCLSVCRMSQKFIKRFEPNYVEG